MAGPSARRPLPAVIFLVALSLLSALVWWRVLHRDDASSTTPNTATHCTTAATTKPLTLPKPAAVSVSVLNGTTTTGLAAQVATQLKARGFKISGVPTNDTAAVATTEIRYGPSAAAAARLVQIYVPGAKLVQNTTKSN